MVMASLHIICGNCGCNNSFEYDVISNNYTEERRYYYGVNITCNNCNTIHDLEDSAKPEEE